MKKFKILFVFWLFIFLLPNLFAQGAATVPTTTIGWDWRPPSYLNYIWSKDPHFFNQEWDESKPDTAQVFYQSGIPTDGSKQSDHKWYREVNPDNHPIPDEGFRLYHAMETPDSAVLVAQLDPSWNQSCVNPEKVEATVQVSFYDGNNILGVYEYYQVLSLSKKKYMWDIESTGTQMKHITAFSINLSVNGDTARMGSVVRLYDYKLYKGDSVIFHDSFARVITGVEEESIPTDVVLEQNYPNPFNPETVIRFMNPESGNMKLTVYDILGREVATLVNEEKPAGNYEVSFNGSNLASGPYVYVLQAGNTVVSKKMLLMK